MDKIDKYYLLVTFGKELESDGNGNEGRRMILEDISGENTYYYGWFGPPERTLLLFEEEAIEVIKNKLNVYSQGSSQSDFILDCNPNVIGEYEGTILFDDNFFDQYGALIYNLVVNNDVPIISSYERSPQKEVYLILDPSEAPQQKESKVLRTLATGQSDITRHEAYTKAQGLNEFNSSIPKYTAEATYEYVDLGLTSGTKWAKMNVGAKSETDPGLYFAWGETQGYTASQVSGSATPHKDFSWSDYALTEDSGLTMSKYNATDNKTHLELTDDAASVNMGGDWHMPNREQCIELLKETKNGFVTNAGVFTQYAWNDTNGYSSPTETTANITWSTAGHIFFKNNYASVTDAISANDYLFIPAAGSCHNGGVIGVGEWGNVWSSFLSTDGVGGAWFFGFGDGEAGVNSGGRGGGLSVRGVVGQINETPK